MAFKRENHELLLQKQYIQLIQKNPKNKTPFLHFTTPGICHSNSWKKYELEKKNPYKLEMVFKHEIYEPILKK